MTGVRLEDLPPAVRARVRAAAKPVPAKSHPTPRELGRKPTAASTWRCHACCYTTSVWTHAEDHADAQRHGRIELVLEFA